MKTAHILDFRLFIFDLNMAQTKKYYKVEEYIEDLSPLMQNRLFVVREIILHAHPEIKECIKFNLPFYTLNGLLFYFTLYKKKQLVLGVCNGAHLKDTHQLFNADANQKYIRHLHLSEPQEPNYEIIAQYIEQSIHLNISRRTFSNRP
jgi:hypothetical protein